MNLTTPSKNKTQEINKLHEGITSSLRKSVEDAIRIGELLSEVKDSIPREEFLKWIVNDLPFGESTSRNYIRLFTYKGQIANVANLTQAYSQIETIVVGKRREREQELRRMIDEKKASGRKRLPSPRTPKRMAAERLERKQRKQSPDLFSEPDKPRERDSFEKIVDAILNEPSAKNGDLALADMRDNVRQGNVFTVLKEYIESFDGVSRQLEATYNLMRYLKRVAIELQPKTQEVRK